MNELSTKICVMYLIGGDKHFLTEQEAEAVKEAIKRGDKYIDLGNTFFAVNQFAKLISGADFAEVERIKQGEWVCRKHNNWVPKGMQCGLC